MPSILKSSLLKLTVALSFLVLLGCSSGDETETKDATGTSATTETTGGAFSRERAALEKAKEVEQLIADTAANHRAVIDDSGN